MKKERKHTDIRVSSEVYVDSHGGYHFKVFARIWGSKILGGWVYQTGFGWEDFPNAPDYLTKEAEAKILLALKDPKTVFHEYDRDRNKRYTDLRYHDEWTRRFQVRALSLGIADETPPTIPPMITQAVFPLGQDSVWGSPVWLPINADCPRCGKEHSKYRGKTLAYFHAPIAVVSGYCHDCEGFTVCLLDDDHKVAETYFDLTWELREWPLYYAPF
jgi:hypothetical protein